MSIEKARAIIEAGVPNSARHSEADADAVVLMRGLIGPLLDLLEAVEGREFSGCYVEEGESHPTSCERCVKNQRFKDARISAQEALAREVGT